LFERARATPTEGIPRTILTADALIATTAAAIGAMLVTETVKDFPMPEIRTIRA
jgi:hypothetical protein